MYKKILFICFFILVQSTIFGATITSTATGGNWNSISSWVGGVVPLASDDVVIATGSTVTVTSDVYANNLSVSGTGILTINNGKILTVYGNVSVASGASFNAGTGNSDSATIKVFGDFINQGTANFWKSTVVIAGNLITASTILQNNGNIIVGGNVSGVIGGSGSGIVYPVNPNATVTVIGSADEKPAGTIPTDSTLLTLMYEVIYGGNCPFIGTTANISACSGANAVFTIAFSTPTPSGSPSAYQWQYNKNDGSGWISISGATSSTLTVSSVNVTMDKYKYRAQITWNSCVKYGNYGVLTVNASPTSPTVGTITNPTCTLATGSVVLSGLTIGSNLVQTGASSATIAITATTQTVSGLAGGIYKYAISNGTCTSSVSADVVITPIVTNLYSGTWSNGTPPATGGTQNLVFNADYTVSTNLSGCSCTVNTGKTVTVNSGITLALVNEVSVLGSGTLTFEEAASLVQTNATASNVGSITYKRSTTTALITDYTYWSSPVIGQTLYDASPLTPSDYFYGFDSNSEDWYQASTSQTMAAGIGYIIRGQIPPNFSPPGFLFESVFQGSPNNGTITITGVGNDHSYLLGNPYPSAIDADTFLTTNSAVLDGTIYFWTHNTPIGLNNPNPGSGAYAYSSNDYALYNLTGGTVIDGITYAQGGTAAPSGVVKPSGKIAACQGFFVSSKVTTIGSTIVFNNGMRVVNNNTQFFKQNNSAKSKTPTTLEKNRIWLNLSNTEGLFKQALVGYISGATNGYDDLYDGESFDSNPYADFYSINEDKNLTIQGRSLPFDNTDEVPLGYRSEIEGQFTINIDETDGLLLNQEVYLEDKATNTIHDLKQAPYVFASAVGTFDDRFVLRFTDKNLGKDDFKPTENTVVITKDKKEVKIKSGDESIQKITVYDLLGRKVFDKEGIGKNEFSISNLALSNQAGIIKVALANGKIVTKKILF
jgi:hypothetical protein